MIKIECKDNVNISVIDGSLVVTIQSNEKNGFELISNDESEIESGPQWGSKNLVRPPVTERQKHEIKELWHQGYIITYCKSGLRPPIGKILE